MTNLEKKIAALLEEPEIEDCNMLAKRIILMVNSHFDENDCRRGQHDSTYNPYTYFCSSKSISNVLLAISPSIINDVKRNVVYDLLLYVLEQGHIDFEQFQDQNGDGISVRATIAVKKKM